MARALEGLNCTLAELGERQERRRRLLARWSALREEADKRSARAVDEVERVLDLLEDWTVRRTWASPGLWTL